MLCGKIQEVEGCALWLQCPEASCLTGLSSLETEDSWVLFLTTEWRESEAQVAFLGPGLIYLANGDNNSCLPPSVKYWVMRSLL